MRSLKIKRRVKLVAERELKTIHSDRIKDFPFTLDQYFEVGFAYLKGSYKVTRKHQGSGNFMLKINSNGKVSFPCTYNCPKPPAPKLYGAYGLKVHKDFFLQAKYLPKEKKVQLSVRMPKNTYFGLTLGEYSMYNTDMVIF